MSLNQQINRHIYAELTTEFAAASDRAFTSIERLAETVPFVFLSGLLFLSQLTYRIHKGVVFNNHDAMMLIIASGIGCVFASVILITRFKTLRTIQGIASFIGNASIMYTMSGI